MSTLAMPLLARHPGRHARRGPVRQAVTVTRAAATVTIAGLLAGSWLMLAATPQQPRTAPRCVQFRSCTCRYPGAPAHLNGNRLCPELQDQPAPAAGRRP